jgi:hypothetical protein
MKKYVFAALPGIVCIAIACIFAFSSPRPHAPIPMMSWKASIAGGWLVTGIVLLLLFTVLMAMWDVFNAWDRWRARRRGHRPESEQRPFA